MSTSAPAVETGAGPGTNDGFEASAGAGGSDGRSTSGRDTSQAPTRRTAACAIANDAHATRLQGRDGAGGASRSDETAGERRRAGAGIGVASRACVTFDQ